MKRNREIEKSYSPDGIETKWYDEWIKDDMFRAKLPGEPGAKGKPFSIVIPPPNVTGSLHIGHAFNNTFQDILCRVRRMQGFDVLWLPGTDHAGIATQNVVEKDVAKSGLTRHSMGREKFVEKVWEWKELYGSRIITQMKRLGNSCDWSRERFTLDEGLSRAVREVFVKLYKKDLIYKGKYIINWCSRCHTALSDLEVEHEERAGKFYYVRYPFADGEGYILVATTRPETILGDVAVAVHPRSDKSKFVGRKVRVPLTDRVVPIIEDNMVDPDFGTGYVKITPAHDPNDYLVGKRHDLEQLQVIDSEGIMNENALAYTGMTIDEARKKAALDIRALGLMEKVEEIKHSVGHCQRCNTTVEPFLSEQWFVRTKPLADRGVKAVKDGLITWTPEQWEKTYFQWMENVRDWCISRQLWWGHRIPAWTCEACGHITVSETDPDKCEKCASAKIVQDEDVLDTWFSSALWPFSTMGWGGGGEENNPLIGYYYPTSLMVTGFDIIFFWVSRMIMMGLEFMDEEPFRDVYIHSLIRDEKGRKMSKSSGNVIDPLDMIEKYGADGLRMALAALSTQGRDILLSSSKIETYRFFMNKLWNGARFALSHLDDEKKAIDVQNLALSDKWILTRTQEIIEGTTSQIDAYDVGAAARALYDFVWGDVCDWYLEMSKKNASQAVLEYVFRNILILLHPFVPFITEELWEAFGYREGEGSIMCAEWARVDENLRFAESKDAMQKLQETVRALRNLRAEARVTPQQWVNRAVIRTDDESYVWIVNQNFSQISALARVKEIQTILPSSSSEKPIGSLSEVTPFAEINLVVGDILDIGAEIVRLEKDIAALQKNLATNRAKLSSESFVARAPAEVVEQERQRCADAEAQIARITRNIESLRSGV